MNSEDETRKLLKYRNDLENKLSILDEEINALRRAIAVIDTQIVRQGFRKPVIQKKSNPIKKNEVLNDQFSIKSKNGDILGFININNNVIEFIPEVTQKFSVDMPPFKSFLIDRVLSNMKNMDEQQASKGEKTPNEVILYDIETQDTEILKITIKNYGDDRRLREIRSSIRWVFDKMYEKIAEE